MRNHDRLHNSPRSLVFPGPLGNRHGHVFLDARSPRRPFDRDKELPPTVRENLERKYGLDKPLPEQYLHYLTNVAQGDLGVSMRQNRPVTTIIREGLTVSMQLGITAFLFATIFGVTMGSLRR